MLQPVYNKHAAGNWNAHYEATYRRQARFVKRMKTVDDSLQLRILNGQVRFWDLESVGTCLGL